MRIAITADSTCDLSAELMERYGILPAPLTVEMGGELYKDMVDISPDDIYKNVDGGGNLPRTSAVNADEYRQLFLSCLETNDAVIHINLSSEMSTCYQNAIIAAEGLKVYPVDSRNLSTASGHLAIIAREMADEGMNSEEIARAITDMTDKVDASFIPSRLDYLHKGGRCSSVAMLGANLLRIRPCIEVSSGVMGMGKKYRGSFVRCLENYVKDRLGDGSGISKKRIFITHSGVPEEQIEAVRAAINGICAFDEILETRAGCTISSHCGPSTLGILFVRE